MKKHDKLYWALFNLVDELEQWDYVAQADKNGEYSDITSLGEAKEALTQIKED